MADANFGAKSASGAYQAIIAAMPPHDVYIETHLGTGIVMREKPPAARSIAVEVDAEVLGRFEPRYPVERRCEDCHGYLRRFDFAGAGRVFVYADPPYLLETRTSTKRYRFDYTVADHVELLELLRSLPARVMVSGYPSDLYDVMLVGLDGRPWRTLEFQVMTRGGPRTEKLWMNYDASAVHWASFAGRDFTDRQRIKRKAARWAAHFARLPAGERLAVLAALLEVAPADIDADVCAAGAAAMDGADYGGRFVFDEGPVVAELRRRHRRPRP